MGNPDPSPSEVKIVGKEQRLDGGRFRVKYTRHKVKSTP
jgi:hypothetical protein